MIALSGHQTEKAPIPDQATMALFKNNSFAADDWRALGDDEIPPLDGKVSLTLAQWRKRRDELRLQSANIPLGLRLDPGDCVETLANDLGCLSLVVIRFPKFTDGRGYSMARQIRTIGGFTGELRATGDILFDQLQLLSRCGFDAFEISDGATLRLLEAGRRPNFQLFYQPGLGSETAAGAWPWARRPLAL
jgi:phosphoadenosine phosphosulfate reductase